jgi:virulence-associated protein VapD
MDSSLINTPKEALVAIDTLTFGSYQLVNDSDYQVVYSSYTDADNKTIRTAKVTINVANFESQTPVTASGSAVALKIKLNNGEVLNNQVTVKLVHTATLVDAPIAWSISERSLKETTQTTVKNPDNTTSTVETEVVTFEIELKIFSGTYAVGVSDVTWDGKSILKSAEISNGKAVVYLSNPKINKLETTTTATNNLVITLSNGYTITNGYKLTIINVD